MEENNLILARTQILENITNIFKDIAVESHVLGSVARGDADPFSDLDIWFTFDDDKYKQIVESRVKYFNQIGEIVHICEPPQNAPIGGVHSAMIVKNSGCLIMVDVYMCPLSNSFITGESKRIFGIDLPILEMGQNPQKVEVNSDYRIDFFICFVFNTIKKIIRKQPSPLSPVLKEYDNLRGKYNFALDSVDSGDNNFESLKLIIKKIRNVSTERQTKVLDEISTFLEKMIITC